MTEIFCFIQKLQLPTQPGFDHTSELEISRKSFVTFVAGHERGDPNVQRSSRGRRWLCQEINRQALYSQN